MNDPILILGGGINGVAIARQLLINGQSVVLVDSADIASGATAYSSRLIHGGLRYLEYAEVSLVRESLDERSRLLKLAPQFVKPLELFIPSQSRLGGAVAATRNFLGIPAKRSTPKPRGAWLVGVGLTMYDLFARASTLPKHRRRKLSAPDVPPVDPKRYGWLSSYYDAQIRFPERFVVGMIADCEALAKQHGVTFELLTYHMTHRDDATLRLEPQLAYPPAAARTLRPRAVVNATGSYVDRALKRIDVDSKRLMGGTKGSHLITFHPQLREMLAGGGVYAEADDGRPVFLLPFGDCCLIGTTDIFFDENPAKAKASDEELDYLVAVVNSLFPQTNFSRQDIECFYCGVRPLPYRESGKSAASVTRNHILHDHPDQPWPMLSIIGGKLTTCRSLAEETAQWLAERVGFEAKDLGRDRPFPGHEDCRQATTAADDGEMLVGTQIPLAVVDAIIADEHVRRLGDLVERRLMLLYHPRLSRATLDQLAARMMAAGILEAASVGQEVAECEQRLLTMFGKQVAS
ncbi:glycerol-3-phosphate dehydrogenase/oxidase [Rosistilla oblonga]|uniref:glycerol-3-phosphate dehydrogenase/oxidase n=1 Tax=Rosistilla oblonga TaxID=2527990 RepID=UPI003A97DA1A